jgi:hypothetical protein
LWMGLRYWVGSTRLSMRSNANSLVDRSDSQAKTLYAFDDIRVALDHLQQ